MDDVILDIEEVMFDFETQYVFEHAPYQCYQMAPILLHGSLKGSELHFHSEMLTLRASPDPLGEGFIWAARGSVGVKNGVAKTLFDAIKALDLAAPKVLKTQDAYLYAELRRAYNAFVEEAFTWNLLV